MTTAAIEAGGEILRLEGVSKSYGDRLQADITSAGRSLASASDLDIAKALAHALAPALPAPTMIEAEAIEVKPEGEA